MKMTQNGSKMLRSEAMAVYAKTVDESKFN